MGDIKGIRLKIESGNYIVLTKAELRGLYMAAKDGGDGIEKFTITEDFEKKILEKYGAFGEKKMYGKTVKGVIRTTFLIDPKTRIVKIWRKVRVDGHAEKVLEYLTELSG